MKSTREGDRLIGPFCALWYLVFVLPLFLFTPDVPRTKFQSEQVRAGLFHLVERVRHLIRDHAQVALFLLARMLYADGLGAIFAFGGIYAATVFGWGATELGLFGIILTISGTIGAALGGILDDRFGSKRLIATMLVVLIIASLGVLSVDQDQVLFVMSVVPKLPGSAAFSSTGELVYLGFAILIGLTAGPIQSASRTLLARTLTAGQDHGVLRLLLLLRQDHRLRRAAHDRCRDGGDRKSAHRHRHLLAIFIRRSAVVASRQACAQAS